MRFVTRKIFLIGIDSEIPVRHILPMTSPTGQHWERTQMTTHMISEIRHAVGLAVRYWPNAHLGDVTPREDIRGAFHLIRMHLASGLSIQTAVGMVEADAYRHADM